MNHSPLRRTTATLSTRLMFGASVAVMAALAATAASAQSKKDTATQVEEVVVTGTSIKGTAPVGSNIVSVGQAAIQTTNAQTVQDVLKSVPSVVGLQSAGQGAFGSADGSGTDAPTIHGLGASASNSTLVLIDGHRFPLTGLNHQLGDPNIIPTVALQRVEVLADGASSVYGSDAVAGVVNFITRSRYDGAEISAQSGYGNHYQTQELAAVAGKTWDTGYLLAAYQFSNKSALQIKNRPFAQANHIAQGGTNFASFNCAQATIQPAGSSNIFTAPYTTSVSNAQVNAMCDYTGVADLLPSERRSTLFVKGEQQISENLTLRGDMDYSTRANVQRNVRGNVTATIFGPGNANVSQINPYYIFPTGSVATSETIRWAADGLLGPGAHTNSGSDVFFAHGAAEYKFTDAWRLTFEGTYGRDTSSQQVIGAVCASCALLALNGTTNSGGSLTAVSVPATGLIVTQVPLTASNAINPFAAGGGAAAATGYGTLANLTDSTTTAISRSSIGDALLRLNGDVMALPAGEMKVAAGVEMVSYRLNQDNTRSLGIGPASNGSGTTNLAYHRDVTSAYAELFVPIVGPSQNVPGVYRFDFNISGRADHYSDFGDTSNPRVGATWEVIEGFKLRANYAQSFVAPALTSFGVGNGLTGETSYGNNGQGVFNVPIAAYPTVVNIPGIVCNATTCAVGTSTVSGAQISGGSADLKPQVGKTWSYGFDWRPSMVPGLFLSATFWHNGIVGGITAPVPSFALNSAALNGRLILFPVAGGATPAQIAAIQGGRPTASIVPGPTYFVYDFRQGNVLNLTVEGVDMQAAYSWDTSIGRFTLDGGASYKTKFDQQVGSGTTTFSVLNTTGFNTTFPSIQLTSRVGAGWKLAGASAELYWNHTGSYKNWSGNTVTPINKVGGYPSGGGGDTVAANDTFDGHAAYDFHDSGLLNGLQLYVDVSNMFDKKPPFYNSAVGYDTFAASPIGRVTSIGFRKKF